MSQRELNAAATALLGDAWEDKDYGQLVSDGAALERLAHSPDYAVLERRMSGELALCIRKAMAADSEPARSAAQGAMLQQLRVMKLPATIVQRAAQAVKMSREDSGG